MVISAMTFEASELDGEGKGKTVLGRFNCDSLCLRVDYSQSSLYCEEDSSHFRVPLILPSRLPSTGNAECWQAFLGCCFGQFVVRQGLRLVPKLNGGGSGNSKTNQNRGPQRPSSLASNPPEDPRSSEIDPDTLEKNISDVKSKFVYALGMQMQSNNPDIRKWIDTKKSVSGDNGVKDQDPLQQTEIVLTHLNLQEALMRPLGYVLPDMQRLTVVRLQHANIDASATVTLCEGLRHTVCLDTLDLEYNRIGQGGAEAIGRMKMIWAQLSTLLLNNPTDDPIGSQGAIALFEPPPTDMQRSYLNSLTLVSLEGQMIGDRGVDGLVVAFPIMKKIVEICISRNEITESGADLLIKNLHRPECLRYLSVYGNVMSSDTETRLKQALENSSVSRQEMDPSMKSTKEQLRRTIIERESQLKKARAQYEQLRKEVEAKESSKVALQMQNSDLSRQISATTDQLSQIRQTKARVQKEFDTKNMEVETLRRNEDPRIPALENDKARATKEKTDLDNETVILERKKTELEQEQHNIDGQIQIEGNILAQLNDEIAHLQQHCKVLAATVENQHATVVSKLERPLEQKLIAVLGDQINCFDVATSRWRQLCALRRQINVDYTTSSTFIAPTTIFLCGGGEQPCTCHVVNRAYMLQEDGSVQELPHMSAARYNHGITWDSDRKALYVFGGYDGGTCYTDNDLRTSEMFLSNEWSPLSDMHQSRSFFTPCWYASLVYLCGGVGTNSVETYDPRSDTFDLQDFTLPESSATTAVVECGVMTVVSENYISRLQEGRFTSQTHEKHNTWSNCTPVFGNGAVYVVKIYDNCCRCVDLTTGEVRKEFSLS